MDRYCVGCHNQKLKTAGVALDGLNVDDVSENAGVWEKVLRKVRSGQMPPPGLPRPDAITAASFTAVLESSLDRAAVAKPNPGSPAIHRLNRAEYSNAVRDLLALDIQPGSLLPGDDSGYGFDNIADVLSISPVLLERYMSVARKVSRLAVGDANIRPAVEQFPISRTSQDDQVSDDLPFGSRGGLALKYHFPLDAEYKIRVLLRPGPQALESDDKASYEVSIPVKAGDRTVGVTFLKDSSKAEAVAPPPSRRGGAAPAVRQALTGPPSELDLRLDGARLKLFEVPLSVAPPALDSISVAGPYKVEGPGATPSRQKIFVCHPSSAKEEAPCATTILTSLAKRAYRRPVTAADIQPLLHFYEIGRKEASFDNGIELALRAMLVSPNFLFRVEREPAKAAPGTAYRINDYELASRLSFFLWSSIPDDELLGLAAQGKLNNVAVLEAQVHRMLDDPRSQSLVSNFAGQWLYLRNLALLRPDPDAFPDFDESLRESFRRETELFFETMLREDRSVVNLLDANFTFLNARLARHYGVPNIYGTNFRRVVLTDDNRGGLLGQGSILMVTSYPNRTSVVQRGKWILENLLGSPPPPPPANIPDLKAHGADGKLLTLRQQMETHRANAICASCHSRMDPLGFALENYDGIGKWRTSEADVAIDASGKLPDGTTFVGPIGLKKVLLTHKEEFVSTVTEKLLTYALGRGLEYYDMPAIRSITRDAAHDDYRLSALVTGIVKSTPFNMRRTREQ